MAVETSWYFLSIFVETAFLNACFPLYNGRALHSVGAVLLHFGLEDGWKVGSELGGGDAKDITEMAVGHFGSQSAFVYT